jgi:hypothetical protein
MGRCFHGFIHPVLVRGRFVIRGARAETLPLAHAKSAPLVFTNFPANVAVKARLVQLLWKMASSSAKRSEDADGAGAGFERAANVGLAQMLAIRVSLAWKRTGLRLPGQPKAGQRHASQTEAEFLQGRAPRDGLGHAFG